MTTTDIHKLLQTFRNTSQEEQDWYSCSDPDQRNTRCSGYESIWEGFSSVSGSFGKRLRLSQTIWRRQRSHMEADPAGTAVLAITRLNSLKRRSKPCDSSDQIMPCLSSYFTFFLYYLHSQALQKSQNKIVYQFGFVYFLQPRL